MTTHEKFKQIESLRLNSKHDLYVIAGQLSESNIDPIETPGHSSNGCRNTAFRRSIY